MSSLKAKHLKEQINLQDSRLNNLQDLFADNKIAYPEYIIMKSNYKEMREQYIKEIKQIQNINTTLNKRLERSINHLSNLQNIYSLGDITTKIRLLSSTFPEKLSFDGSKCRTPRINELLNQLLNIDKGFKGAKKDNSQKI